MSDSENENSMPLAGYSRKIKVYKAHRQNETAKRNRNAELAYVSCTTKKIFLHVLLECHVSVDALMHYGY